MGSALAGAGGEASPRAGGQLLEVRSVACSARYFLFRSEDATVIKKTVVYTAYLASLF